MIYYVSCELHIMSLSHAEHNVKLFLSKNTSFTNFTHPIIRFYTHWCKQPIPTIFLQ